MTDVTVRPRLAGEVKATQPCAPGADQAQQYAGSNTSAACGCSLTHVLPCLTCLRRAQGVGLVNTGQEGPGLALGTGASALLLAQAIQRTIAVRAYPAPLSDACARQMHPGDLLAAAEIVPWYLPPGITDVVLCCHNCLLRAAPAKLGGSAGSLAYALGSLPRTLLLIRKAYSNTKACLGREVCCISNAGTALSRVGE